MQKHKDYQHLQNIGKQESQNINAVPPIPFRAAEQRAARTGQSGLAVRRGAAASLQDRPFGWFGGREPRRGGVVGAASLPTFSELCSSRTNQ